MLSPQDIYKAVCRSDNGIDGYDIPRFYLDAAQVARNRDLLKSIDKGQTSKRYETRRGNYIDDYVKPLKNNPSPLQYQEFHMLTSPTNKVNYPRKQSIFGEIIEKGKRIKHPGVGSYDLIKSVDSDKKAVLKPSHAKRQDPFEHYKALSDEVPGPGAYNPRPILPQIKPNQMKPKDWRAKHKKPTSLPKLPAVGTYSPMVQNSFAKIQTETPTKRPYWGSEKRFHGLWAGKSVMPGPGTYEQLSRQLDYGISKSIYQI